VPPRIRKPKLVKFRNLKTEICPACLDRNAVTLDGRPVRNAKIWHMSSAGCDVCGGRAETVTVERLNDWPRGDRWVYSEEDFEEE